MIGFAITAEMVPDTVGQMKVLKILGKGGHSWVLLGEMGSSTVALKIPKKLISKEINTLRKEYELMYVAPHPYVAEVVEFKESEKCLVDGYEY